MKVYEKINSVAGLMFLYNTYTPERKNKRIRRSATCRKCFLSRRVRYGVTRTDQLRFGAAASLAWSSFPLTQFKIGLEQKMGGFA